MLVFLTHINCYITWYGTSNCICLFLQISSCNLIWSKPCQFCTDYFILNLCLFIWINWETCYENKWKTQNPYVDDSLNQLVVCCGRLGTLITESRNLVHLIHVYATLNIKTSLFSCTITASKMESRGKIRGLLVQNFRWPHSRNWGISNSSDDGLSTTGAIFRQQNQKTSRCRRKGGTVDHTWCNPCELWSTGISPHIIIKSSSASIPGALMNDDIVL